MLQLPLSLPQRLDPGASPRFAGINLSGLAAAGLLSASLSGQLQAATQDDVIAALGYTPTNAAVIPTGAPAAGQVLVGNAGGTAYARKTLTGDVTVDSAGVTTIGATRVLNSMLLNPAVTISGHSVALGASLALAQADVSGLTTASSPTFAGTTLSALANAGILAAGTGGALRAATISDISFAAQANGLATLGGDGKLTGSQLPAIAITDTFVVASQAAMLALTAQTGDIAIRTDISTTFVLSGTDPSILSNWTQVLFNAPVTSVAGRTGVVTLANTDVGLAFVTNDAQTKAAVVPNTLPSAAQVLIGNAGGTAYAPKSVSGDGGLTAAGVLTVTKLNGVSPGPFFDATNANLLSGTLQAAQFPALTGDVTASAGSLATSIAAGAVTLAKMANLPGDTFIGNASGSAATPAALTSGQATALLATFVGDAGSGGTKGLVPAPSAGDAAALKYLAADGTWKVLAVPVSSVIVGTTLVSGGTNTRILYDNAGTLGEYTAAGAKSFLGIAYADVSGLGTAAQANLSATDKQFVFNDGGALGGSALLTFDKSVGTVYLGNGLGGVNRVTAELVRSSHLFTNPTNPPNPTYHQVILQDNLANFAYTADTTFINKAIMVIAGVDGTNTANWTRTAYPCLVAVEGQAGSQPGSTGTINMVAALSGIIFNSGGATIDQAVGAWIDPSGSGFNYYVGVKATGLEHGTNNTGIYLGIDQSIPPAVGNWGFYDCTGYASHFGGNIEIVGAVTSGAWNGTKIGLAYGGTNKDLTATGGASQVLRQSTLGGDITVSALTSADVGLGNVDNTSDASKTATLVAATHTWALAQTFTTAPIFTDAAGTRTALGLNNVTNDAQTKASIVPNTTPSAGQVYVGNAGGTAFASVSISGDATLASTGALTIAANAVTYAKLQQVAASSLLGNATGSLANATGITLGSTLAFSGSALQTAALTGDVTASANSFATTIAAGAVTLGKMANLAANSIVGNNTGSSATPLALTSSQVKTLLAVTASDVGLGNVTNDAQAKASNYPNAAQGQLEVNVAVDFHTAANTDFSVTVALPIGCTRWRLVNAFLNGASASLSGGTFGVFSGAGGTGTAVVASGTSATLAVTTENTANNMQSLTPANSATATSYTYTTIFFRVQNVSSVAATCNFTLQYCPMS